MSAKYTLGPWEAQQITDYGECEISVIAIFPDVPKGGTPTRGAVCHLHTLTGAHFDNIDECNATARLIAAAPELLEALIALTDEAHRNMVGGAGHLIDDARAAIAKARGKA